MPRHHGDPRSDALGEQPYDEREALGTGFSTPAQPPVQGNAGNFIPYRGQALHGVQLTRDSDDGYLPYAREQQAQDEYTDPTVTPRDIVPVPPVNVKIVDSVDLLYKRKARAASFEISDTLGFVNVAQANRTRKRIVINVTNATAGPLSAYLGTSDDAQTFTAARFLVPANATLEILDSETTENLWVDTTGVMTVSVWQEYTESNGDKLL
ncbi:hypothetical protein Toil_gp28 [Rhodococcus phage Toil]|uniref:Uncharacterized protein n=1 Tax=Rhodococcus phage Toil TaxID=1975614 RepID=A0A1W6DXT9_9VIRU|nr:hypothetical protein KMD62_gp28 [Rhodococcus phage Toil]ARK07711.1 hypothetical protein Toil_gp28 [Rhodococcus phage Toil]